MRPFRRYTTLLLVTCAILTTCRLFFRSSDTPGQSVKLLPPSLVNDIDRIRREWGIKGATITLVKHEEGGAFDEWEEEFVGLGVRDGQGNPMERDSLFAIGSNSKLFTAVALGLAVQNASLDPPLQWTTKVKDVLPGWRLMDLVAEEEANLVDLLAHRTGLPSHLFAESQTRSFRNSIKHHQETTPPPPVIRVPSPLPVLDAGYLVASTILSRTTGTTFTSYVRDHLLAPLGMTDTGYEPAIAKRTGRRVEGFVRLGRDLEGCVRGGAAGSRECQGVHEAIGWFTQSVETMAGQSGVISSSRDMATWMKMLLLNGRSPTTNETIIPSSVLLAIDTPRVALPPPAVHDPYISPKTYGVGQFLYTYRGHQVVGHFGAVPGQMSQILRIPKARLGVVVTANDNEFGSTFTEMAVCMVLDQVLGLEPVDWKARSRPGMMRSFEGRIAPKSPPNASLPDLWSIPGTCVDGAYGTVTVCAVETTMPTGNDALHRNPASCEGTLASHPFNIVSSAGAERPKYIARLDKHWINYLLFEHLHDSVFTVTPSSFYPEKNISTNTPFGFFTATFTEEGMEWGGNAWSAWPVVEDESRFRAGVNGDAGVWFDKVRGSGVP